MAMKQLGAIPASGLDVADMQRVNNGPSYGSPQTLQHHYEGVLGVHNWRGGNTRTGDNGLANAAGAGMTSELWVGTSASAGCTNNVGTPVTYDRLNCVPLIMRDQLAAFGTPANGDGFVRCTDLGVSDARWTSSGAGWTAPGGVYVTSATLSNSITFTATRPASICEVHYNNTFTGTMTVVVDGATVGTIVGAGTSGWTFKKFPNLAMVAGSTVVITLTTAGTGCGVSGVRTWTPNAGVIMDNVSQSGSMITSGTTSNWADAGAASPKATFKDVSGRRLVVTDAVFNGTTTVTSATANFTANKHEGLPLDTVPGASTSIPLPPGTYIVSVTNSTTAVMSKAANLSSSGNTMSIGRDPSVVHIEMGENDIKSSINTPPATITAAIQTFATAVAPNSDVYLHLPEELNPALVTGTAQADFQAAMFVLSDQTMNVPLIDWRDRTGGYLITYNSVYGDSQAHLNAMAYRSIGAQMALYRCPGGGRFQSWVTPLYDGDNTNKAYVDGFGRFKTPIVAEVTLSGTGEQIVFQIPVPPNQPKPGTTCTVKFYGTLTGVTTPGMILRARAGPLGTATGDTQVTTTNTSVTPASGGGYVGEVALTYRTIGASGTIFGACSLFALGTAFQVSNGTAAITVDTTQKHFLTFTILLAGTSPVIHNQIAYTSQEWN